MNAFRLCHHHRPAIRAEIKARNATSAERQVQFSIDHAGVGFPDAQSLVLPHESDLGIVSAKLPSETSAGDEEQFTGACIPKARAPVISRGHQDLATVTEAKMMHQF